MTLARWRRIEDLLAGLIPPGARSPRHGPGGEDKTAGRRQPRRPQEPPGRGPDATAARPARPGLDGLTETVDFPGPGSPGHPREMTPKPAIGDGRGPSPAAETIPLVRDRL